MMTKGEIRYQLTRARGPDPSRTVVPVDADCRTLGTPYAPSVGRR